MVLIVWNRMVLIDHEAIARPSVAAGTLELKWEEIF